MIDLNGIQYPIFAGVGALLGLFVSAPLCLVAIFIPTLWAYAFAPVWIGAIIGLVWAAFFMRD